MLQFGYEGKLLVCKRGLRNIIGWLGRESSVVSLDKHEHCIRRQFIFCGSLCLV